MSDIVLKRACLDAIAKEIKWCNTHKGESAESADFEKGFVRGLQQARRLIRKMERELRWINANTKN